MYLTYSGTEFQARIKSIIYKVITQASSDIGNDTFLSDRIAEVCIYWQRGCGSIVSKACCQVSLIAHTCTHKEILSEIIASNGIQTQEVRNSESHFKESCATFLVFISKSDM